MTSLNIHVVAAADSPEFDLLLWALRHSVVVGLDAEWKPRRSNPSHNDAPADLGVNGDGGSVLDAPPRSYPAVTLLQIACRVRRKPSDPQVGDRSVFLVDLLAVPLAALCEPLREMFVSPAVIKLGFRFKQDLLYLSSTFSSHGLVAGLDEVEPFLDITTVYYHLNDQVTGKKHMTDTKSLSTICKEVLNVSLSKDLQCSDWSCRPLSEEQIYYAAADAYYLLEIFAVFQQKICTEVTPELSYLDEHSLLLDHCSSRIVSKYGEKILLKESDKRRKPSRRKGQKSSKNSECKEQLSFDEIWEGPPAWDVLLGGDGCPKFLCDVMVEGLAKHLRCVGIDTAIPTSKKPDSRQLLDQAYKEKRVLLSRDAKLIKQQYLRNQVYRVKSLLKNDQLLEVIEAFNLKISEEQLMSRCTKCNGSFIQKPLTTEEAIAASKGFQVIPQCLFNRNLEFWQCTDCKQIYWEGTQYHNAVQKFVEVCKLND